MIQLAELSWEQGNSIILKLVPIEGVPEAWYSYQSHCDGEPHGAPHCTETVTAVSRPALVYR